MKKWKGKAKWLGVLLSLCMVLAMIPITALAAGVTGVVGETGSSIYTHTYHTKVNATAQVTIKDANGNVVETTSVNQVGEDFIEGNLSSDAVQAEITRIYKEIEAQFTSRGIVTVENQSGQMVFDHFESSNIIAPNDSVNENHSVDKNLDVHEYQEYQITYELLVQENGGTIDEYAIENIDIVNAILSYNVGDTPRPAAGKGDENAPNYEIEYEYWEEMEQTANGLEPVAYWYSDESKNNALPENKRITAFEEGKSYMYSLSLKAINGRTFATADSGLTMTLNGESVNVRNITVGQNGTTLFAVALKTMKPTQPVQKKPIELIEVNGVTTTFKVGDKPVFTGTTPDNALYYIDHEGWGAIEAGVTSSDYWNGRYGDFEGSWGKLLTSFEANIEYTYNIYLKLTDEAVASGYYFDKDKTKLSINGKIMDMREDSIDIQPDSDDVAWFWCVLTMRPTISGTPSVTPSDYKIIEGANSSWTQNSDETLTFRANGDFSKFTGIKIDGTLIDAKNYTVSSGSTVITLKADYLKTLPVGTHKLTVVYTDGECSADFETKQAVVENNSSALSKPNEDAKQKNITSPKTGDSSNMLLLWFSLLFATCAGLLGTVLYSKRKRHMG